MNLRKYQTFVFDCDGVVLNSNKVKTEAFYKAALPFGEAAARQLVEYHVSRGGISRYKKFEWFAKEVVSGISGPSIDEMLKAYADEVRLGLLSCELAEGLFELKKRTADARWLIVSGGDQQELRQVFAERNIDGLFDGGIFGSPDTKETILARELQNENIIRPALFIGDSKYDYEASVSSNIDCLFLSGWSEVENWESFCLEKKLPYLAAIKDMVMLVS